MKNKIREITFTGMMIALCIVLNYVLSPFPNVKPVAAILILLSLFVSTRISIVTGSCVMIITGFMYGFGIWSLLQILGFIAISVGSRLIKPKCLLLTLGWGALGCYIYGFIVNFSMLPYITPNLLIPTWISGLPFDTVHCISTIMFLIALYEPFKVYGNKINSWIEN
jgi:hypothetical protein